MARAATGARPRRLAALQREVEIGELPSKRLEFAVKVHQPTRVATDGVPGAQVEAALGTAYGYVNKRERTAAEVARRLRREGFSTETTAQTLAFLQEEGTLDDRRFARLFTDDKRELEHWGSERIRRTLAQRGVDSDTVAAVVDVGGAGDVDHPSESERGRALALLHRRFPEPPRSRRDRDRALGVLLRKGYEPELAVEALSAYSCD